jgi:protein arginine kinase activator
MLCGKCKKRDATVHISGFVDNKSVQISFCESCARNSGFNPLFAAPFTFAAHEQPALTDLTDLLSSWHAKSSGLALTPSACPVCHWTISDFQKTGMMGCAECYLHFQAETDNCLRKVQGHVQHKGKKAPAEVAKAKAKERRDTLTSLKAKLDKAVKEENYEAAAMLRDRLKEFEKKNP